MLAELAALPAGASPLCHQPLDCFHSESREPRFFESRGAHIERLVGHLRSALLTGCDQLERGHVVFIDSARRYLGDAAIGAGNHAHLVIQPREVLAAGFKLGASGMILAHNHPSGECRPSEVDIIATKRLAWLGEMVDLLLLDHLIITASQVYSMRAGRLL